MGLPSTPHRYIPSFLISYPFHHKMKFFAVAITSLATLAAASRIKNIQQGLTGSGTVPTVAPMNECVQGAQYCNDPSIGSATGAACYIFKYRIKVQ